jgi:hypothetical protein
MNYKDHLLMEEMYSKIFKEEMGWPTNWDKGFEYPFTIAAVGMDDEGQEKGQEEPFIKNGKFYILVWNREDKKHYIYSYSDDIYYPDTHEF